MSSAKTVLKIDLVSGAQKEYSMPEHASSWSFQVDDKIPSYFYEIDVDTFSVVEKTDISGYGQCLAGSCFYNDKLYFAFGVLENNTELDYICECSLKTKELRKIGVGAKNPTRIKEYNGLLYIVQYFSISACLWKNC